MIRVRVAAARNTSIAAGSDPDRRRMPWKPGAAWTAQTVRKAGVFAGRTVPGQAMFSSIAARLTARAGLFVQTPAGDAFNTRQHVLEPWRHRVCAMRKACERTGFRLCRKVLPGLQAFFGVLV